MKKKLKILIFDLISMNLLLILVVFRGMDIDTDHRGDGGGTTRTHINYTGFL